MKRTLFLFCLLWSLSLCLSACSDDDGLVYPPDVADAIPDGEFRVLCLQLADTDLNGVISKEEALAVRKIDCMPDRSYVRRSRVSKDCTISPTSKRCIAAVNCSHRSICREIPVCAISIAPSIRSKNSM